MNKSTSTEAYRNFLTWLKEERVNRDLTMRDVGALINEPHQFISKIECAERRLDVYEYVCYCEAIGINPSIGLKILSK